MPPPRHRLIDAVCLPDVRSHTLADRDAPLIAVIDAADLDEATGWAAKITAIPHWIFYAAGAVGFWRMSSWMWPWAAVYSAQIAVGMLVWSLRELEGASAWLGGIAAFIPFAALTFALWTARPRFQRSD